VAVSGAQLAASTSVYREQREATFVRSSYTLRRKIAANKKCSGRVGRKEFELRAKESGISQHKPPHNV